MHNLIDILQHAPSDYSLEIINCLLDFCELRKQRRIVPKFTHGHRCVSSWHESRIRVSAPRLSARNRRNKRESFIYIYVCVQSLLSENHQQKHPIHGTILINARLCSQRKKYIRKIMKANYTEN